MTVVEMMQLYAPLAGLLGVVFWLGVLSQRVRNLEDVVRDLKSDSGEGGNGERIVRLETKMETFGATLSRIERSMEGVQRQLGNLMKPGSPTEFRAGG